MRRAAWGLVAVVAACSSPPPPPPTELVACAGDDGCPVGQRCTPAGICAVCGDGVARHGEPCDDGNPSDADDCLTDCTRAACGDGIVRSAPADPADREACDDGNTASADGCRADCGSDERCGNGIVDDHLPRNRSNNPGLCHEPTLTDTGCAEVCDDGNQVSADGCSANCLSEEVCGNGVRDPRGNGGNSPGEVCDDGNNDDCDACPSDCLSDGCWCGDGVVNPGEQCDEGRVETALCNFDPDNVGNPANCLLPLCGDGHRNALAGEQCDDGNAIVTDDCVACQPSRCGDGAIDLTAPGIEQCDDGNLTDTDNCTAACRVATCGDGVVDAAPPRLEACDDGNANDTDGCRNDCTPG